MQYGFKSFILGIYKICLLTAENLPIYNRLCSTLFPCTRYKDS